MQTAKLVQNGRSQAARLPKEFRFGGDEVGIMQMGAVVVPEDWTQVAEGRLFDVRKYGSPLENGGVLSRGCDYNQRSEIPFFV